MFFRGFILPNGSYVGRNIFQALVNLNSKHDFKLAYKISERHLSVEGPGRMNVKLAVQLLSNTVSKAIAFCGEQKYIDINNWKDASVMITFTDKL